MIKRRYIYWVIEILTSIFIILLSLIMVNAVSDQSVLKPDDIYLSMVSESSGGAFITSELGGEVSGTFVNPNYIERIDFKRGFFPFSSTEKEILVLSTEVDNQFELIIDGRILGKFNIDPFFSANNFYFIVNNDGKGGAILVFLSKDLQKIYVQFIRQDGSIFPSKPSLVRDHKSALTDYLQYFISDNAGGAIFYWSSDIDKKSEFIFVREDGSVFPGTETPAVLDMVLPSRILSDGKGNAVFTSNELDNINIHFYDGTNDVIIPIAKAIGPSRLISDEREGFIVLWDDRTFDAGFGLSAAFVRPDNSVSQPIRLDLGDLATEFSSIVDFLPDSMGGASFIFYGKNPESDGTFVLFLHSDGTLSGPFHVAPGFKMEAVVPDDKGGILVLYREESEFRIKFISSNGEVSYLQNFLRGDTNNDEKRDLSDAIFILNYLFQSGNEPNCLDSADTNDDGKIDLSDAIYLLNHLFIGGPELPQPNNNKDFDRTRDQLACVEISA